MALEVILRLDEAQEFRQLSPEEQTLRKRLKLRVQGVAVIERARRSQAARLRELKFGDANSKFFPPKNQCTKKEKLHTTAQEERYRVGNYT